jgi:poly(hydroxyalkanoate) depolymerase family esterase
MEVGRLNRSSGSHNGALQHKGAAMKPDRILQTIDKVLTSAGLDTSTGPLSQISTTIRRALEVAGVVRPDASAQPPAARPSASPKAALNRVLPLTGAVSPAVAGAEPTASRSQFLTLKHSNHHASRCFKLFIPSTYANQPMPLIVMLHGCKQNPDDFAAGTRMNGLAEQHGFLVAYPEQSARDNGANCWNWFERAQQSRDGIEPASIAGIVGQIGSAYQVDASRVFVAGLSAGAAMAVILGATYPEVFAGVAAHSGLPLGAAHSVVSAFAAMQRTPEALDPDRTCAALPTIVIYGDADSTVRAANGAAIVAQSVAAYSQARMPLQKRTGTAMRSVGNTCSTTEYVAADGGVRVAECVVHGGNHAWFGGSNTGTYTDANGPDASAEIVRFFLLSQPQPQLQPPAPQA